MPGRVLRPGPLSTLSTGIVPLCAAAAQTWRRVDGAGGQQISPLAASVVRGLVGAQVAVILDGTGKSRWCELATGPDAAGQFFQMAGAGRTADDLGGAVRRGGLAAWWPGAGGGGAGRDDPGNVAAALQAEIGYPPAGDQPEA